MAETKVSKAIIPVAGLGTRMLPATKAIPKELLPILNKPIIQYVVEEAISAGIKEIIFITRSGKQAIENHFDYNYELEHRLKNKKEKRMLNSLKGVIPGDVKISSIRQEDALGLGHAISCAEHLLREEPFAVLLPDEYLLPDKDFLDLREMVKNFNTHGIGQILVEKIGPKEVSNFGIVNMKKKSKELNQKIQINDLVEKPKKSRNKINYRIVGRYILTSKVIKILKKEKPRPGKEIELTKALQDFIKDKGRLDGIITNSKIFDCGSKKGFIGANIASAIQDKEMKKYILKILEI
jgi:UTP--glucose-1-phosphate uridylyltransferase